MNRFFVAHIQNWNWRPFWILETYQTTDGPRTRITDKRFATLDEANEWIAEATQKAEADNG